MAETASDLPKFSFGDRVENALASPSNPRRIGYFVRQGYRQGRLNPGAYYEFTDGQGDFWTMSTSLAHNLSRLQSLSLDREEVARIVDPLAWKFADRHAANPVMAAEIKHETRHSLAKADLILSRIHGKSEGIPGPTINSLSVDVGPLPHAIPEQVRP